MRPPKRCAINKARVRGVRAAASAEGGVRSERLRIDVFGDGTQPVPANYPDHVGVRDGRDEDLIPTPQALNSEPEVPTTAHRIGDYPVHPYRAQAEYPRLQPIPPPQPATRKNTEKDILERDIQPVPRVQTTPLPPTNPLHAPSIVYLPCKCVYQDITLARGLRW